MSNKKTEFNTLDLGLNSSRAVEHAKNLAERGIEVCPVDQFGQPMETPSRALKDILRWSETHGLANFAAACGRKYGLAVIDVDEERLARVEHENGPFPLTWRVRREPGKVHLWFKIPTIGKEIEPPMQGPLRWTLFPKKFAPIPGGFKKGATYAWETEAGAAPSLCPLAMLPADWLWALRMSARPAQPKRGPEEFDASSHRKRFD